MATRFWAVYAPQAGNASAKHKEIRGETRDAVLRAARDGTPAGYYLHAISTDEHKQIWANDTWSRQASNYLSR